MSEGSHATQCTRAVFDVQVCSHHRWLRAEHLWRKVELVWKVRHWRVAVFSALACDTAAQTADISQAIGGASSTLQHQ